MGLSNGATDSKITSKALKVAVLFIFILCLMPSASAKDYTMEGAITNITIGSQWYSTC